MKHILTLCLSAALAAPLAAQDMIGVSWTGSVYSLDSATGSGSLIGASGYTQVNNMAKSPSGTLYACAGYGVPCTVIEINPTTGAGTMVSTTTVNSVRGMSYFGNTLYLVNDSSGTGVGLDDLYKLDPVSGVATFIGSTGFTGVQGLGAANGVLYGWDINYGLLTINPATGAATDVNASVGGTGIQNLCANASGELYGGQYSLYKIDAMTGVSTLVGSGGYSDLRGMEFIGSGGPSFTLTKTGTCPGPVTLSSVNGTPGGAVAVVSGGPGSTTKPSGVCAGTTVPLSNPTLRAVLINDGAGATSLSFNAPAAACGATVVFVDLGSCDVSNAVTL